MVRYNSSSGYKPCTENSSLPHILIDLWTGNMGSCPTFHLSCLSVMQQLTLTTCTLLTWSDQSRIKKNRPMQTLEFLQSYTKSVWCGNIFFFHSHRVFVFDIFSLQIYCLIRKENDLVCFTESRQYRIFVVALYHLVTTFSLALI